MKPTMLAQPVVLSTTVPPSSSTSIVPFQSGAIILGESQLPLAQKALAQLDFATIPAAEIVTLGHEAEQHLHQTLDGFLARLDKDKAGKLFELFGRLEKGVNDAQLPTLLVRLTSDGKPNIFQQLLSLFRSKKKLREIAHQAYMETCGLLAGKTKTLQTVMNGLETDLQREMKSLFVELSQLDNLKRGYRDHIDDFALAAAVTLALRDKAETLVATKRAEVEAKPDALAQAELQELENKFQLLDSRAAALEGVYTALPANEVVIQQIENAGVTTLQETATTASARFSNIKMTLLELHGAVSVQGLQQLTQSHADMDRQLATIRGSLTKQIVTVAANAPGENRLAQAEQIRKIIEDAREVHAIVVQAREDNAAKFETARSQFAEARNQLATLSAAS